MDGGLIVGASLFGRLAMANTWKKYVKNKDDVIELRRLCCIDDTPKNTESFFISRSLRWLKQHTSIKLVISYADETYGHHGGIYKASNFEHVGYTSPQRVIEWGGRLWHDKTIRTKYKGKLKPFAKRVKDALERGDAKYVKTKRKNIYLYNLDERRNNSCV